MPDGAGREGGDFFSSMLSDLLRMVPSGSGFQYPFAYQLAASTAAGEEADPNPDPRERIALEQLTAIAALHVADVTGMSLTPSGRTPRLTPTSRSEWVRRVLDSWREVLDQLAASTVAPTAAPASADLEAADGEQPDGGLGELVRRWMLAMQPMLMAMQVGSAVGHLAHRALGQYEVPLAPALDDEIFVVSANLASMAEDWSLPAQDLGLWLATHELAHHAVLSRPHVAARLRALVVAHAAEMRPDPGALAELMSGGSLTDPGAMLEAFGDPAALALTGGSPERDRARAELDALVATISGYAEHVTATVAARVIGGHAPIGEAMRRRRVGRGDGERFAEQLFGLCLDQDQVDRGKRFVDGVIERSGEDELARLFVDEASLPTPAEVDAPGLWLARLGLETGG